MDYVYKNNKPHTFSHCRLQPFSTLQYVVENIKIKTYTILCQILKLIKIKINDL